MFLSNMPLCSAFILKQGRAGVALPELIRKILMLFGNNLRQTFSILKTNCKVNEGLRTQRKSNC